VSAYGCLRKTPKGFAAGPSQITAAAALRGIVMTNAERRLVAEAARRWPANNGFAVMVSPNEKPLVCFADVVSAVNADPTLLKFC
jgi:hypothetical protein